MKIRSPGSNDLVRVDPGPESFTSRVADVMVRKSISLDGFLQTLVRRPGLNTGSFFLDAPGRKLRSRSQVPGIKKPGLSRAFYLFLLIYKTDCQLYPFYQLSRKRYRARQLSAGHHRSALIKYLFHRHLYFYFPFVSPIY